MVKTCSEGRNVNEVPYFRQELLALSHLSIQHGEECGLVLRFRQYMIDLRP